MKKRPLKKQKVPVKNDQVKLGLLTMSEDGESRIFPAMPSVLTARLCGLELDLLVAEADSFS